MFYSFLEDFVFLEKKKIYFKRILTNLTANFLVFPIPDDHGGITCMTASFTGFVYLFGFNGAFNIICHITTVSGCDRVLSAHFHSAASLWYQIPDTLTCYQPQSHYTATGATSPSPTPKIRVPSGEQLVPLLTWCGIVSLTFHQ